MTDRQAPMNVTVLKIFSSSLSTMKTRRLSYLYMSNGGSLFHFALDLLGKHVCLDIFDRHVCQCSLQLRWPTQTCSNCDCYFFPYTQIWFMWFFQKPRWQQEEENNPTVFQKCHMLQYLLQYISYHESIISQ